MNKNIYYNNSCIILSSEPLQPSSNQLIVNADNLNEEALRLEVEKFIQQDKELNLNLYCTDINKTFDLIKKQFKCIEAAGGIIQQKNKFLFIYRLKKWDLPKGKIDKGESKEEAAIRECEEECAISGLNIIKEFNSTYHIYHYKNKLALKITYWYLMDTEFNGKLMPQISENIEKAEWLSKEQIKKIVIPNTYSSVLDLINVITEN